MIFLVANCKRYLYFHPSIEYPWKMHWQRNMCREHLRTFSNMTTIVKVVMFCSSSSSSDSSAKTNQRAFRVYLAVEVTNYPQIIHGTVFVTIGES